MELLVEVIVCTMSDGTKTFKNRGESLTIFDRDGRMKLDKKHCPFRLKIIWGSLKRENYVRSE